MSEKLPPKILVIESDGSNSYSVGNTIERSWFDVYRANSEESAIKIAINNPPNVAVISSEIKEISAHEMAIKLRKLNKLINLPIILVYKEERVTNNLLDDEFVEIICQPFTPFQLMTKVKSLLRKSQPIFQDKLIKYKDVSIDLATYKVFKGQQAVHLGPTEFKILHLFLQFPRVIFSREYIINYVWGENKDIEPRTVDVHVNRLRTIMSAGPKGKTLKVNIRDSGKMSALKLDPYNGQFIKTVRSSGYCLNLPGEII
ncbi:MAG: winged helix-turn-helix domain-containing protein [Janthinobacterium lividum]